MKKRFKGEDDVKRNMPLYQEWAVISFPNRWVKPKIMDEWNDMICRFCNALPEGSDDFSKRQWRIINIKKWWLLIKDSIPITIGL